MAQDDLRLGLVGTGGIAKTHILAMAELKQHGLGGFLLSAVCDMNADNSAEAAGMCEELLGYRPAIYNDYREMLEKEKLDGADLCLPHGLHHSVSIDCMEAGVNVLCEKPLGITIKASRMMAEAADRTGRLLSVAVPYRRLPGMRLVRWALNDSGLIGKPLSFFNTMARGGPRRAPAGPIPYASMWRRDRLMSGGGPAMDGGFHWCDGIRFLLGEVDTIYARAIEQGEGEIRSLPDVREDTVFAVVTFKNGITGTWSWSFNAPGESFQKVLFYGSEGSISTDIGHAIFHLFWRGSDWIETGTMMRLDGQQLDFDELKVLHRQALSEQEWEFLFPAGIENGFGYEIWEFLEVLRGNRERVEVDAWDGMRSLAVCEAVYESATSGQVVKVDDVLSGKIDTYQAPINEHWKI
ncbi:MAG: Gfo/Idh/MocA family oxidoreductase [Chloroflexi bacterium]|nr:Gfo/Idh/MocA family oxidoreductase [Chloroflexota bacterium]